VGYRFSLILSRVITDDESELLKKAGCASAVFGTDTLPTNAEVTVTKMDFDDTVTETLAEAIEAGLEAVKNVPDLSVPGLEVPAQPATREDREALAAKEPVTVAAEAVAVAEEKPNGTAKKRPSTRKTAAKKPAAKKTAEAALEKAEPEKASVGS
jgi:hypothetical protein